MLTVETTLLLLILLIVLVIIGNYYGRANGTREFLSGDPASQMAIAQLNPDQPPPNLASLQDYIKNTQGRIDSIMMRIDKNSSTSSYQIYALRVESKPDNNVSLAANNHKLMFQSDGNLVIYTNTGTPVWATNTNQTIDPNFTYLLMMTACGNYEIRKIDSSGKRDPIWNSNTETTCDWRHILEFDMDGTLGIYKYVNNEREPVKILFSPPTVQQPTPIQQPTPVQQPTPTVQPHEALFTTLNKDSDTSPARIHVLRQENNLITANHKLTLENDGNLALYNTATGKPVWATNTYRNIDPTVIWFLRMLPNGNLVLNKLVPGVGERNAWSSDTPSTNRGEHTFEYDNDGTLGIYKYVDNNRVLVKSLYSPRDTNTWPGKINMLRQDKAIITPKHKLILQTDGNLVLYNTVTGAAVWSTNTWTTVDPNVTYVLVMLLNGNLVLVKLVPGSGETTVWSSQTPSYQPGEHTFEYDNDGTLGIYKYVNNKRELVKSLYSPPVEQPTPVVQPKPQHRPVRSRSRRFWLW